MGIPCIFSLYSLANLHFVCFPCADLSHEGPPSLSTTPLQGASQPVSGRPTTYLTVETLFGTIHALSQWGKGGPCFILWNGEMDTKSINLHWICTNRKQASVLSAWCNLKTEYSRLLGNRFELCGSTCMQIFSVNTTVLHDLRLVKSTDMDPWIQRNHGYGMLMKLYTYRFLTAGVSTPNLLSCSKVSCNMNQLYFPVTTLKDEIYFNNVFYLTSYTWTVISKYS